MAIPQLSPFPNARISDGMMEGSGLAMLTDGLWSFWGQNVTQVPVDQIQFSLEIMRTVTRQAQIVRDHASSLEIMRTWIRKLEG